MKKYFSLVLTLTMVFSLAACGNSGAAESSSSASEESGTSSEVIEVILQSEEPQTEVSSEPETETGSNFLVRQHRVCGKRDPGPDRWGYL